ncbi:retrovirus-related pol polyprotein from transposon TNT 1-94 [Tanacetum coccineum]
MVRSMMSQTSLLKSFWDYALETAIRILNMVPTKKGCEALVKRDTLTKPDKLEPRSIKCIFIRYPKKTIEASRSLEDLEIIQEEDTHPSIDTILNHEEDDQEIDEPQSDIIPIRDLGEPANYKAALLDPDFDKWLNAINVEMQSIKDNEVWDLVDLPPNGKTIGKTFSPVADNRAIRILISIAAYYDYEIWQMDVKTTFLNGYLFKEVYMEQPEDDILIMRIHIPMLQDVKSYLGRFFAMKDLGEAAYILEIKIYKDRSRRYQQNLGDLYWTTVKNILKYLRNSKDMFLEAEYIATSDASKEAVWVRKFIYGLGIVPTIKERINMYCDNTGAIAIANESRITKGTRHFHAKVHYLCEVIEFCNIKLKKVHTDDNLVDPFRKVLAFPKHSEHTRNIGMLPTSSFMQVCDDYLFG